MANPSILDSKQNPIMNQTSLLIPIFIIVPNLGGPKFVSDPKTVRVTVGEIQQLKLPSIIDPDKEDVYSIEQCDFGGAGVFIQGSYP